MAAEESTVPDGETGSVISDTLSDAELIAATRAGDASAFAVLYTRHVGAARACARRLARTRSEADDLVAEGFAKVLGALRKGKGPDLAFRPYLLTAVRNALYDRTRRDSRVQFTDEPPEPVNAVLLAADYEREDRAMVAQAYAALPERWQLVLWHTDVEGRQPAEIAPLLGISANSVAALAYRAREGLRQAYLAAHVNRGVGDTCRGTTEKLSAYVRDGLSARDRRTVQDHLDSCAACTALLGELQEANRNLKVVLIPVLAGVSTTAYLGGLSGGGITRIVRRNPARAAAAAVAAAAALVVAAVALSSPGGGDEAQALTVPPVGSGRPTTTTTLPRTTVPPAPATVTVPFTPPPFDTAVPPITVVPFNPNATTATTVRRQTTTTRPTTTTRAPTTTTTPAAQPGDVATTTTTTTTTTTVPGTQAPVPPALMASVTGLGPVYSGQSAYFSVKVANAASGNGGSARNVTVGPADGVVVTFNVPAGATFAGTSRPDWQCEAIGASVRCLLPRIEAGADTEAVFSLAVAGDATVGSTFTISPTVMVNGDRIDAQAVTRAIEDGATVADFQVLPGGDVVVGGNSLLTCPDADSRCAQARTGLSDGTSGQEQALNRQSYGSKQAINVLGAPYFNSSAATIDLGGRQVASAHLVWTGRGNDAPSTVAFVPPGRAQIDVTSAIVQAHGGAYVATADVTEAVRAVGTGVYAVANVPSVAGADAFAGWSLIVLVTDPAGPLRAATIVTPGSDFGGNTTAAVSFGGLPPNGGSRAVKLAVMTGEGELGVNGSPPESASDRDERLTINGTALAGAVHPLPDANGQGPNAYRSAIAGTRSPAFVNNFGVDLDVYVASVDGTAEAVEIAGSTTADAIRLSAVALLYDL